MRPIHTELKWRRKQKFSFLSFLPPANEVCEGYVFTGVCLSTWGGGGMRGCSQGGHAWLSQRGVCGCSPGGCMVFWGGSMHGFWGGSMHGFLGGGVHGFWGSAWFFRGGGGAGGACMVFLGGMHGFSGWGGACVVFSMRYGQCFFYLFRFRLRFYSMWIGLIEQKRKRSFSLMFVAYSLIIFAFALAYLVCVIRPLLTSDMFRRLCGQCFSEPEQPSRGVVWRSPDLAMTRR